MKKLLVIFVVVAVVAVMAGCVGNSYDERCDEKIVLYPTTEVVTDSLVIDSTTSVLNATVHIKGHLSDTMFVSFTDGSYPSWHNDTLYFSKQPQNKRRPSPASACCLFASVKANSSSS